jgi:hypothetical protein
MLFKIKFKSINKILILIIGLYYKLLKVAYLLMNHSLTTTLRVVNENICIEQRFPNFYSLRPPFKCFINFVPLFHPNTFK